MTMNKYYPGEPINIHIQPLINIMQENNWVITTKKGKGKLPLFCGDVELLFPFYDVRIRAVIVDIISFILLPWHSLIGISDGSVIYIRGWEGLYFFTVCLYYHYPWSYGPRCNSFMP